MARAFEAAFHGDASAAHGVQPGFFSWVDGAPAAGYRAPRTDAELPATEPAGTGARTGRRAGTPVAILTGEYGAAVLGPLLPRPARPARAALVPVHNAFFGGNIAVTGLLTGVGHGPGPARPAGGGAVPAPRRLSVRGTLPRRDDGGRSCPRPVEVVPSDGLSLRLALHGGGAVADVSSSTPRRPGTGRRWRWERRR